jgi:hypothetical protein
VDLAGLSAVVEPILGSDHRVNVEESAQAVLAEEGEHALELLEGAVGATDVRT